MNYLKLLCLGVLFVLGTVQLMADDRHPQLEAFHNSDFRGERLNIREDWSARHPRDYWNDAINSVIIPNGYEAHLFEHTGFRGEYLVVRGEWSSRQDRYWHNRISSIRLVPLRGFRNGHRNGHRADRHRPAPRSTHTCGPACGSRDCGYIPAPEITIFEHHSFRGAALTISGEWSAAYSDDFWNDRISSVYIPRGYAVILYEHAYFQGRSVVLEGSWNPASSCDFWNDRISSLRVVRR